MEPTFRSLLYDHPHLYDLVFPDPNETLVEMCRATFKRYLPVPPTSLLDIGCGNGRLLASLSASIPGKMGRGHTPARSTSPSQKRRTPPGSY